MDDQQQIFHTTDKMTEHNEIIHTTEEITEQKEISQIASEFESIYSVAEAIKAIDEFEKQLG